MSKKTKSRRRYWLNAKGEKNSGHLIPPDLNQCQAFPNLMSWSPMSFGPMPKPIRCENAAHFVIVENKATHKDGLIGAMSLCGDCLVLFRKNRSPTFAKTHAIEPQTTSSRVQTGKAGRASSSV